MKKKTELNHNNWRISKRVLFTRQIKIIQLVYLDHGFEMRICLHSKLILNGFVLAISIHFKLAHNYFGLNYRETYNRIVHGRKKKWCFSHYRWTLIIVIQNRTVNVSFFFHGNTVKYSHSKSNTWNFISFHTEWKTIFCCTSIQLKKIYESLFDY